MINTNTFPYYLLNTPSQPRVERSIRCAFPPQKKAPIATCFTLLSLFILSGCVTATVSPPKTLVRETIPEVLASDYPTVAVHQISGKHRAGTLYAILVIPVGSIFFLDPEIGLEDSVTRAIVKAPPLSSVQSIEVSVNTVEMKAYDLLITRQIRCSIEGAVRVTTTSTKSPSSSFMVTGSLTRYRTLAFSHQISQIGRECFEEFGTKVVSSVVKRISRASEVSSDGE